MARVEWATDLKDDAYKDENPRTATFGPFSNQAQGKPA